MIEKKKKKQKKYTAFFNDFEMYLHFYFVTKIGFDKINSSKFWLL